MLGCICPEPLALLAASALSPARSKGAVILKKVCGVLVLLGGQHLIYTRGNLTTSILDSEVVYLA